MQFVKIDSINHTVDNNGQLTKIDPSITRLAIFFAEHPDTIISRAELAEKVWDSHFTSDDAINRSISLLRKALSSDRMAFIKTIPKKGYCFIVPENVVVDIVKNANQDGPSAGGISDIPLQPTVNPAETQDKSDIIETPVLIEKMTEELVVDDNTKSSGIGFWLVIISIITVLIMLYGFFAVTNTTDEKIKINEFSTANIVIADKEKNPVMSQFYLKVGQWQSESQSLTEQFAAQVQRYMLADISRTERFIVDSKFNGKQHDNNHFNTDRVYHVDVKFLQFDQNVVVNMQLVHSASNALIEEVSITEQMNDSITTMVALSKQMAAAIRIVLLHPQQFSLYRGALEQFSYIDLEKLIHASYRSHQFIVGAKVNSKSILHELIKKYPHSPYPYGIHAKNHKQLIDLEKERSLSYYQPIMDFAQQALQRDPKNFDALAALFRYYYINVETKDKAKKVADDLLQYYPNHQQAWRNRLFLMARNGQPCENIRLFINQMPANVFKPVRLKVITDILTACIEGKKIELPDIEQQSVTKAEQARLKAVANHVYLFEVRHDNLRKILNYRYQQVGHDRYLLDSFWASLQMDDALNIQVLANELKNELDGYNLWLANLYAGVHQMNISDIDVFDFIGDYQLIDRYADLYFATMLAFHAAVNHQYSDIVEYLQQRPVIDISVANRFENIARMIALYGRGDIQQSEQIANRIYHILDAYRLAHPNSFDFYNLGRFMLLAAFYCGEQCINLDHIDAEPLLNRWFAKHHIWWLDDAKLMAMALSPWNEHPLVRSYLVKIEQDKARLKEKLGI